MHGVWRASSATLLLVASLPADTHLPGGQETALTPNADVPNASRAAPEFAPMDPDYALTPGLFRSVPKGGRKQTVELTYRLEGGNGDFGWCREVEFVSPYILGPEDLRTLQGLMALAAEQAIYWGDRSFVINYPQDELGRQLALRFEAKDDAREQRVLPVVASMAGLARAVGLDDRAGESIASLRRSLKRLSTVTVFLNHKEWRALVDGPDRGRKSVRRCCGSYRLASACWADDMGGVNSLRAAVNPQLSGVAFAGSLGQSLGTKYIRMDMREVRALRAGPARLIHQRLCAWINPGRRGRVKLSTLAAYAWHDAAPSPNAAKWRRKAVRRALRELQGFERAWAVSEYAPGKFEIGRPDSPQVSGGDDGGVIDVEDGAISASDEAGRETAECLVGGRPLWRLED